MKIFLVFLIVFSASSLFSQEIKNSQSPYFGVDKITEESNAFQREKWFYSQRMYPFNSIPPGAYENAINQRDRLRKQKGFSLTGVFDTWTNIGPRTGFYFGWANITSRIISVKYDIINPNIIYVGAANGGVWKSVDGGLNWEPLTDFEVSLASGAIAVDPTDNNIIYYATGEATYSNVSYYGKGLLKSTNGGLKWVNYPANPVWDFCSRLVIRPGHNNELLAAVSYGGLLRSTNSGETWTRIVSGRCDDVVFSPTGDTVYAVGSGTGYVISENGGASFTSSNALTMGERNHIAVCKSEPSVLYFAKYSNSGITVFKSTNEGTSFSQIATGQNFNASQGWFDFYMYVNPFDPNYAYVGSIDIWRTTNGGSTNFVNITSGYSGGNVHVDQHNLDFHPSDPQQMLCVNDGGIWKSTNKGTNWTNQNTNQSLTQFYRIASDPSNSAKILGGTQDNGTQMTTGSMNWNAPFGGDGGEVCFHSQNNSYVLGETQNNNIYRSTNGGLNFSASNTGLNGTPAWIGPIISHPDSAGIFYTARQSVFKSTNWGASWFSISTGTSGVIEQMAIGNSAPNVMYVTSNNLLFKSTNKGYTFTNVTGTLPNYTITSVNIHPDSGNVAVISYSGFSSDRIYKTSNGGSTWFSITGNLPIAPVNDVLIFYPGYSTPTYYIANDVGVFVTNDFGQNWIEFADGLPNTVAMHLDYHIGSKKLRIGTHGRGVYEITLQPADIKDAASVNAGPSGSQYYSSASINPTGTVRNNGIGPVTFNVTRTITPGAYTSTKTVTSLGAGTSITVTFAPWTFISETNYFVRDTVSLEGDINNSNDTSTTKITPRIYYTPTITLNQGFYLNTFPPTGWTKVIVSGTNTSYWSRDSKLSSFGLGKGCAKLKFWKITAGTNQALVTPAIPNTNVLDTLQFDYAYAPKSTGVTDSLIVETSTNGGTSFSAHYRMWGNSVNGNLNTAPVTSSEFKPTATQWSRLKLSLNAGINKIRFRGVSGYGNNIYLDSIRVLSFPGTSSIIVKALPEGLINFKNARNNNSESINISLREISYPYKIVSSSVSEINPLDFTTRFYPGSIPDGNYYIVVKYKNSIETWSREGGESFVNGRNIFYDFTANKSMAFGANQLFINGVNCLYSGDINQDGTIDASDLKETDNDAFNSVSGNVRTDITGDDFVDAGDVSIVDNNAFNSVTAVTP
ncbi:MAG: hypothetical protein JST15_04430 [Bacteroidetes bacterium]|nr:hypothetical protein [Bacteroidota bacterium]